MSGLLLGPMLRYVDETSASIWVQTRSAAEVTVEAGEHRATASTFRVHGHHYALVELQGLTPGTRTPYRVLVDGHRVWPEPEATYPGSVVPTLGRDQRLRLAFGSCRVSVPHDREHTDAYGVDAMRAFALHLARDEEQERPDLLLLLGDQVYADETSDEIRAFIADRRSLEDPPGAELKDYVEYAELYRIAWSDPANRWLLSTIPSAMIFDDHDIRDDWNTSWTWRQQMAATSWWHDRIVGGLGAYWVYQHLGNLSPAERAEDPLWRRVLDHEGPDELDLTAELDAFAEHTDGHPDAYRWSFARDFGEHARLVVVDSRAARVLTPKQRSMIDEKEMAWLHEQMHGGFDHLLVGTSLPFLLAPGLHHAEAFSEALCDGAWGRGMSRFGERLRQAIDMEHWAAFQPGFREVADMTLDVASGALGRAPETVTYLSGDVHHSYVSIAEPDPAVTDRTTSTRIVQAVCSPIRNPLPRGMQRVTTWGTRRWISRLPRRLARMGKVPPSPLRWSIDRGPWYDNNLAVLETGAEGGLTMRWYAGDVTDRAPDDPRLRVVAEVDVPVRR